MPDDDAHSRALLDAMSGGGSAAAARLSIVISTQEDARGLRECLESVQGWAGDIVVQMVQGPGNAAAAELCRAAGARMLAGGAASDTPAHGDWLLQLRADERVSPALRAEIEQILAAGTRHTAFSAPLRTVFCARVMRHGEPPAARIRLPLLRATAQPADLPGGAAKPSGGSAGRLHGAILRTVASDIGHALESAKAESNAQARAMAGRRQRSSIGAALARGAWAFIRHYVLQLGVLDGREGFIFAFIRAETVYYAYLKLALMARAGCPQ